MVETSVRMIDKTRRNISFTYRAALSLVGVMIVLVAVITGDQINHQLEDNYLITTAANQRVWSQRIALLAYDMTRKAAAERQDDMQQLLDAVTEMEILRQLMVADARTPNKSPDKIRELNDIYFGQHYNLDALMVDFIGRVHNILALTPDQVVATQPDIVAVVTMARTSLPKALQPAFDYYQRAATDRMYMMHRLVLWLSSLSLFILIAVALLLMRPAVAYIAKAQQRLDELNRLKSDFLANMSHEIRTPMNGIFGMTELLLDSPLDARQQHYARTLQNSADHLLGLINDILDFSKLEAGHMKLDPIHFNLLATIEDVLELLASRAREKNLELLLHYLPGTPRFVVADPGRIRQVLFNLIGNAIKFTDKGYVIVQVDIKPSTAKAIDRSSVLKIRIEDTGIGIPEDKINALFEKFMQVESGSTRARQGTGLGLAISRNLVDLMGGQIHVTSTPGVGTVFCLDIPLSEASEPQTEAPRNASLLGKRVLLVDDLAPNRLYFKDTLTAVGLDCMTAENAQEGLSMLAYEHSNNRAINLILTDYMMPVINGLEFSRQLKADPRFANIPIVALTSVAGQEIVKQFDDVGAQACLDKPLSRQQLLDTLTHVLEAAAQGKKLSIMTARTSVAMSADRLLTNDKSLAGTVILLAEDNRVNLEITTEILTQFGCKVVTAENGKQAIDAAYTQHFDLIFMDCQMPEMDGFEAARHIVSLKAEGKIGPVPIVALTANALKGDRERCLESGMDDYLSKPVRRANLQAILLKWLRDKLEKAEPTQLAAVPTQTSTPAPVLTALDRPDAIDAMAFADARTTLGKKFTTVLDYYIQDGETYLQQIVTAMNHNDPHAAIQPAHTLKSSSRQFGAMVVAELAERMEHGARAKGNDNGTEDLTALVNPLNDAFTQVRTYFKSVINQ